jgi:endonuclease/exonuclease/phosphatase family metal-dependent hydrolase
MRVATYNIRHAAPAGRRADHRGMRHAVRSLYADVVALQEVDHRVVRSWFRDQASLAGSGAGLQHRFLPARPLGPFGRYGIALLLPRGPHDVGTLALRSIGEPRVALFARCRLDGEWVTVVCTHLQNSSEGRPSEAPEQLDQLLEELARWPTPWILMGDLNLRPEVVLPRFEGAGLKAVAAEPTFPAHDPKIRIDWIAVRGLEVGTVEVPPLQASDHLPIVAELVRADPPEPSRPGGSVPMGEEVRAQYRPDS